MRVIGFLDPAKPEGDTPSVYCQMYALWNHGLYALFSTREEHSHLFGQASGPLLLHQDIPGWDPPPDGTQVSHSRTDSRKPQMFSPGGF